jgi:hypothetical protein
MRLTVQNSEPNRVPVRMQALIASRTRSSRASPKRQWLKNVDH